MLVFFLVLPVATALQIEQYSDASNHTWLIQSIKNTVGPYYTLVFIVTVASAIVCGLSSFFILFSRKRVDFYHSLPVRRDQLFFVNYVNGIILFAVPYLINLFISVGIIGMNGLMEGSLWRALFAAIGINLSYYIMIYTIVIIAVMLTGNLVVSGLGVMVLLLFGPALMGVQELYYREFFQTYYSAQRLYSFMNSLSPIWSYIDVIERYNRGKEVFTSILLGLGVTTILFLIALFLYKKRPSEAAGNAMAFAVSKPIIKVLLVVLASLSGGILLRNTVRINLDGWFLFGLIFTMLVGHIVIEIIYNFDLRSAFRNWKQLLLCVAFVGLISAIFRFDLLHYDSYLPKQDEVASMAVVIDGVDQNYDYFRRINDRMEYMGREAYHLDNMRITGTDAAYDLAVLGVKAAKDRTTEGNRYGYTVKYRLKNGKEICRSYQVDMANSLNLLQELYADKEFKEIHNPLNHWNSDDIDKIGVRYVSQIMNDERYGSDWDDSYSLSLDYSQKKELFETYRQELNQLTLKEIASSTPLANLQIQMLGYELFNYFVYPSFQGTLTLLEKYGFEIGTEIDASHILRLEMEEYRPEEVVIKVDDAVPESTVAVEPNRVIYNDQETIQKLLPYLSYPDYTSYNNTLIRTEDYINVFAYSYSEIYAREIQYQLQFRKDEVPAFVLEDLKMN
jgi:ABC-2 type transport system permease protein